MTRRHARTSASHPLQIDEVAAGGGGGRIGITFCPGKRGESVGGSRWERDIGTDLDLIVRWGADIVVTLIEDHEFEILGVPGLGAEVQARGLEWHHLPIVDTRPPDERFERDWLNVGPTLRQALLSGLKIIVHCRGGLGRAGTVAALLLVELGETPLDAISQVRAARRGAIETREQERYILGLGFMNACGQRRDQ